MSRSHRAALFSRSIALFLVAASAASAACAGGEGGSGPIAVASVVITAPTAATAFQTVGRTSQFAAQARDASNAPIAGAAISWSSSNLAAATISSAGLLTVAGNGSTDIRASSSGVQSAPLSVTVMQVVSTLNVTPAALLFGALGSTRQLTSAGVDSGGTAVAAAGTVTWSSLGNGLTASVSGAGLVTALGVGNSDTAVATLGVLVTKAPITVTQLVASIAVTADAEDSLSTTGRTRQYAGVARDSNANVIGTALTWSSTVPAVASVNPASGLATALTDGTTDIRASAGGIFGARGLLVKRYASTFTLTPGTASISAPSGTLGFSGSALDSVGTDLPMSWLSRLPGIATVDPATGTSTTARATGNGVTFIVLSAGARRDSAELTVSGQPVLPSAIAVTVGDFFFRSAQNSTENAAVDTVAVGGTVTWTFSGAQTHNVRSLGSPSFVSSNLMSTGVFVRTFGAVGTYAYDCQLHPAMTGTVVVR